MSQQRNPRYFESSWYTSKFAKEPWPAGWYWHDYNYTWYGPYSSDVEAIEDLFSYAQSTSSDLEKPNHIGNPN